MKHISLPIFALLALACTSPALGMEQPNQNQFRNFRVVTVAQAKSIAHKTIDTLMLQGMTQNQRQAALATITTELNQNTIQNTISVRKLKEIMLAIAQQKNIDLRAMETAFDIAATIAENAQTALTKTANGAQVKFTKAYGSLILLDTSINHLPIVHLLVNQQPRNAQDRTCGFRAVMNARALDLLCDTNRIICSEHLRQEASTVTLGYKQFNQDNLASDEIRYLANEANIHNFYILDAQAYGNDRNYQITFGDTENGLDADPVTTAGNLELDIQNIAALGDDESGAVHFFCNTALKNASGGYGNGHWLLISVVKEIGRPVVVMYQDSMNNVIRPNTLNHLYLYEILSLCNKHARLFNGKGIEVDTTIIDRVRGNVRVQPQAPNNNNNYGNRANNNRRGK